MVDFAFPASEGRSRNALWLDGEAIAPTRLTVIAGGSNHYLTMGPGDVAGQGTATFGMEQNRGTRS